MSEYAQGHTANSQFGNKHLFFKETSKIHGRIMVRKSQKTNNGLAGLASAVKTRGRHEAMKTAKHTNAYMLNIRTRAGYHDEESSVMLFGDTLTNLGVAYRAYLEKAIYDEKDTNSKALIACLVAQVESGELVTAAPELNCCYDWTLTTANGPTQLYSIVKQTHPHTPLVENKLDFSGQVGRERAEIMTTIAQMKNINVYIETFLSEHGSEEIVELWQEEENMTAFKNLITKATKVKKASKAKDPNKPKRGKSSYLYFCAANRGQVKTALGDKAKATDVARELGSRWQELKKSEKACDKNAIIGFEAAAAEDKERFTTEIQGYEAPSDDELEKMKKKKRKGKKKDPNAPKRGKSAYLYFCAANRSETKESLGDEAKATEVASELGRLWNELKEDEDRVDELTGYKAEATADKARYEEAIKNYTPPESDDDDEKKVVPKAKKGKTAPKKKASKKMEEEEEDEEENELEDEEPKKVPKKSVKKAPKKSVKKSAPKKSAPKKMNGYTYFCKEYREEVKNDNTDMKATDITKELSNMWKALDKDEKQEWTDAAKIPE